MSELTVFLRKEGFGPELDALEGLGKTVAGLVSGTPAIQSVETTAIDDLGALVSKAVVGAVGRVFPGATSIANALAEPLVQAVEADVGKFVGAAGTTTPVGNAG